LDALLKGIKRNQTHSEQARTASVQDHDSAQKSVSNPDSAPKQNTPLEVFLRQLQEKHPRKSPEELEKELKEAKRLYSQMDELQKTVEAMKEEIKKLEKSCLQLKIDGNTLALRAHLEKGWDQHELSRAIRDVSVGFWDPPDYEQAITLYEQLIIHYPQKRNQAFYYLALIYLKGKIHNHAREKKDRIKYSDPEKAQLYAQMIECPELLKCFQKKWEKYLAKRK
jgi:tetratricopeptide (TPR) repeat protein